MACSVDGDERETPLSVVDAACFAVDEERRSGSGLESLLASPSHVLDRDQVSGGQ